MKLCVCAVEDHNCMFHLCTECPDKTELSSTLTTIFGSNDFGFDMPYLTSSGYQLTELSLLKVL